MLAIDQAGTGVPLVFLHPLPLNKNFWAIHRPAFAKNFRFIAVDFPGFGESPLESETTSMDHVAEALNHTLNDAGIDQKIVLVGVSMGGYAAFRFIAHFSERLRGLALISTRAAADSDAARQKRFENIQLIEKEGLGTFAQRSVQSLLGKTTLEKDINLVAQVRDQIVRSNPAAVTAALRGLAARLDSGPLLHSIAVPTLVMAGAEDGIVPPAEMEQMAEQIKRHDFEVVYSAGHLHPIEKPREFQKSFLNFLKRRVL